MPWKSDLDPPKVIDPETFDISMDIVPVMPLPESFSRRRCVGPDAAWREGRELLYGLLVTARPVATRRMINSGLMHYNTDRA